jgi:PAS domain S-box-containing protein
VRVTEPQATFPFLTSRDDYFNAVVRHLASELHVKHAFVARCVDWPLTRVRTLAAFMDGKLLDEGFEYTLAGTPCEEVLNGGTCYFPRDVQRLFPDDAFLVDIGCESYFGLPLFDPSGGLLGHICVLDDKAMEPEQRQRQEEVLKGFAARAAAEIDQLRAEEAFRRVMEATAQLAGGDYIRALTRHIAEAVQVRAALIVEYLGNPPVRGRALALWNGAGYEDDFEFDLHGTPCETVALGQVVCVSDKVQEAFPLDKDLVKLGAISYLGMPMFDSSGSRVGHVAVMDDRPMKNRDRRELLLRLLTTRAATELDRMRAEKVMRASEARLKLVVDHAADTLLVYDASGALVDVNRAAVESLGASREELLAGNLTDIQVAASAAGVAREIAALQGGARLTSEAVYRRRDGTTFPVEVRTVLFELDGRELVLAMARDITERQRAEAAVQATLRAMSTPILEVWEGVVLLPVIGMVERERAARMREALLDTIAATRARVAILDLTGVTEVDDTTAGHLIDIARAAALLGSKCLVSGISPVIARTLVELGVDARGLVAFGTLRSALRHALLEQGVRTIAG